MTFVTTTSRQASSPSKKLAMHERQNGICPLCRMAMRPGEKLIDEHLTALGLGGSNDPGNRALVHADCAYAKTCGKDGDLALIAKAKRRKIRHLNLRPPSRLKGAPFPKFPKRHPATSPVPKLRLGYQPSESSASTEPRPRHGPSEVGR